MILFFYPEKLMSKLEYLNLKLKFSSFNSVEKELNLIINNHSLKTKFFDNDSYNCSINEELLFKNIVLLRNIFSNLSLNLNFKAIPINQWIFWQYMNFNQWLSLEEEMEYMRSMIYDIYLTEDYSIKEIFDLSQYFLTELVKFELINENNVNYENIQYTSEDDYINYGSNFSKLLLKLISELINEAWVRQTISDGEDIFTCLNYLNWLDNCLIDLLKSNDNDYIKIIKVFLKNLFYFSPIFFFTKEYVCCIEIMNITNRNIVDFIWRGYKHLIKLVNIANIPLNHCFLDMISKECPKFICMTIINLNDISIFKNISLKKNNEMICCSDHSINIYHIFYKTSNIINQILEFQHTKN
eukprot:jgi/Orpsp1_1/1188085/evm.model.d7180000062350.1